METLEKKSQLNGTAKTIKTVKKEKAASNGKAIKSIAEIKKEVEKEKPKPKFSLDERIQRIEEVRSLSLKRAKTIGTLGELRKFQFAQNESCTLEISDSANNMFSTGNSNLISLLSNHLLNLLQDKVKELDAQILNFDL